MKETLIWSQLGPGKERGFVRKNQRVTKERFASPIADACLRLQWGRGNKVLNWLVEWLANLRPFYRCRSQGEKLIKSLVWMGSGTTRKMKIHVRRYSKTFSKRPGIQWYRGQGKESRGLWRPAFPCTDTSMPALPWESMPLPAMLLCPWER